jgi:hypothetical protein
MRPRTRGFNTTFNADTPREIPHDRHRSVIGTIVAPVQTSILMTLAKKTIELLKQKPLAVKGRQQNGNLSLFSSALAHTPPTAPQKNQSSL